MIIWKDKGISFLGDIISNNNYVKAIKQAIDY